MNILDTTAQHVRSHLTASAATLSPKAAASDPSNSAASATSSTSSSSLGSIPSSLTSESTFLHLLVAQIQNQDPLNPTDSIQFVGQLVQFSQLEQLLSINKGVTTLATDVQPAPASGTPAPASGSTNKTN